MSLHLKHPLTDDQFQKLCTTQLRIASLTFSESERRSLALVSDPGSYLQHGMPCNSQPRSRTYCGSEYATVRKQW